MNILFLCVGNSIRSQMAEGLARKYAGPDTTAQSAGSHPSSVNPLSIRAMAELGIDISTHTSKSIASIDLNTIDMVITLCAEEVCPQLPKNVRHLYWPMPDPYLMGRGDEDQIVHFRNIRDTLKKRIQELNL
jgi:arsenate reductase (thioredoxin)